MSTVAYPHIEITADGHARIAGTGFKVRMLAEEHLITGADAMELQRGHPHLSFNQVHARLHTITTTKKHSTAKSKNCVNLLSECGLNRANHSWQENFAKWARNCHNAGPSDGSPSPFGNYRRASQARH